MKDGFATTGHHGRLHYLEAGTGRPIILLHSNGNSAYSYQYLIPHLEGKYRLIAWEQPGQGDSDRITRHYSVEDYSDAVVEFMGALGLDTASVLGSSIGGMIAHDLGARHADRLDRLFIVEPPARTAEQWEAVWPDTEKNWCHPVQTREQLQPRMNEVPDELLARWNIDRQKAGPWALLDTMWALRLYDSRATMARISGKAMAIFGNNGALKEFAPLYEQAVPGLKSVIMGNSGHFPMFDEPEQLARVIDDFMG